MNSDDAFLARTPFKVVLFLSRCIMSDDVDFDRSLKVAPVSFLHQKVTVIPFITNSCHVGGALGHRRAGASKGALD